MVGKIMKTYTIGKAEIFIFLLVTFSICIQKIFFDWDHETLKTAGMCFLGITAVLGFSEFALLAWFKPHKNWHFGVAGLAAIMSFMIMAANHQVDNLTPIATAEAYFEIKLFEGIKYDDLKTKNGQPLWAGPLLLIDTHSNGLLKPRKPTAWRTQPAGTDITISSGYITSIELPFGPLFPSWIGKPIDSIDKYKTVAFFLWMLPEGTIVTGGHGYIIFNAAKRIDVKLEKQKIGEFPEVVAWL